MTNVVPEFEEVLTEVKSIKPYTFRTLSAVDVFPMFKIISSIGINEFTDCFEKDAVKNMLASITDESNMDEAASIVGISVILEIANVILTNIGKCEAEIYQILSQTSDLTVAQVKKLDMGTFFEMVIDFIKKDEFKDFIKVVSRLFK